MTSWLSPQTIYAKMPRDYWHVREPIGKHIALDELGGYPIDMRGKAGPYSGESKEGFPLRDQNREGLQLLPVTVTQLALGHYDCWLEDQLADRVEVIRRCADWLSEHHGPCPSKLDGWSYGFDHGRLGIRAPFISAMGQGQGISALLRAHKITGQDRYLETAHQAIQPFYQGLSAGGVTAHLPNGGIFFEEYPCQPYSHILNGHIFALWGIHDYAVYLHDESARQLAKAGADTLAKMLPSYDVGYWSRYGLYPHPSPNVASPFYHELHIAQLRAMNLLYPQQAVAQYADRWEQQFDSWLSFTRAVYAKIRIKKWVKKTKRKLASRGIEVDDATDIWTGNTPSTT